MEQATRHELLRRSSRRFWRRLRPPAFRVVYHERYNAAFPDVPNDPLRAERILAFLASEALIMRRCVNRPEPVWLKTLELVHGGDYLDAIHQPSTLTSIMGVPISTDQVDRLIDFQRLQTGGTLMATRRALAHGVGVNLGGGFHHARAERGGGFCIFNDVAVAIADERRRGLEGPILVVDLDLHDGDGTRDVFRDDAGVFTFSIHARHWGPTEARASAAVELGGKVDDRTYLDAVRRHLPPLIDELSPSLVFYLAGCDPAHDDLLGDWRISAGAMLERDRMVFAGLRAGGRRPPLVVLLAGGYSQEAWRYTARFLSDVQRPGRPIEPPATEEITLKRYRYISRGLDPQELSGARPPGGGLTEQRPGGGQAQHNSDNFGLTEDDVLLPGWAGQKETRFLGFYTKHGLELVFERAGFLNRLRDLGFAHPTLALQLDDPGGQTLRIFGSPDRRELLVELRLRRDRRSLPGLELLSVEWLLLQNPRASFTDAGRSRMPGQSHPGLGMLGDVAAMLQVACERLHLDGLVFVPSQFHVAAYGRGYLTFLDAGVRARFEALLRLFRGVPLPEATRAVAAGRVLDAESGEVVKWQPSPMVLPVSDKLARRVREAAEPDSRERKSYRFSLRSER